MAFASLFTLLDDISAVLDDVALMTKMAAKKTAGVVGDDLALNANQVTGVSAERELPVIWQVAKGSLVNKFILIPAALLISWLAPWLITPLLMIGGAFLCFEGVEKLLHKFLHRHQGNEHRLATPDELTDENSKIKGAIRTDFILSAEIIIIALGVADASASIIERAVMLGIIGVGMTVFVYGLVALIVKIDDFGLLLMKRGGAAAKTGQTLIALMPWLMKALSIIGTLAMFLVGGGIIVHGLPFIHDFLHAQHWDGALMSNLANLTVGLITGAIICAAVLPLMKVFGKSEH